jgi:hypothetical protein
MRNLLVLLFITLFANVSVSQICIKAFNYRPTGEYGFLLKPAYSLEIGSISPFTATDRFRINFSGTFINMKPRMDTIPIYGAIESSVYPGIYIVKKWNEVRIYMGVDYAFFNVKQFFLFGGIDVLFGGANTDIEYTIEHIIISSNTGGRGIGGLRLRLGAEYKISNKISVFSLANRQLALLFDPQGIACANDYGIGVCFKFRE